MSASTTLIAATNRPGPALRGQGRRLRGRRFDWARFGVRSLLFAFATIAIIPMLWLLITPSKTEEQLVSLPPLAFGNVTNYSVAWSNLVSFQDGAILRWAWNSLWYTGAIVLIGTASAVLAGYALASTRIPLRRTIVTTTLIAMLVPGVALILPLFLQTVEMGIYNSPWAFILIASLNPFGVFLSYIYFSTAVPVELYEAARIDGASEIAVAFRIAMPLARGHAGIVAFFVFIDAWATFFLPYVLLGSSSNFTLPVGLGVLFSTTPALNPGSGPSGLPIGRPEVALAGALVALPILVVFLVSSRLLTRGAFAGSVKS
ncbi:multiple sugar transport system permease protein [Microbacterium sp. SLBN-154]|nr:multiple sugar transport system permease protein [Microbacterium sp. SLBN-154]